jgi:hypothetical protein
MCDLWPRAKVVLRLLWGQVDVPGILLPSATREIVARGMLVTNLTYLRSVMLTQEGARRQVWKETRVDLGVVVDSAKSQCG